ncbi:MAG: DUF2695 domain-containing protein [Promethearchaeota archaeon]
MKKHRRIIIRNELLRNVRNNLRTIILKALNHQLSIIQEKQEKFFDDVAELGDIPDELAILEEQKQSLNRAFNKSICICSVCQKLDKDMVYTTKAEEWFCIDCYENKIPKKLHDGWEPIYPLTKGQVLEFLEKLKKLVDECETNLTLSKKILTEMGIGKRDQKVFLNTLYQYGGHCDCEILMNVYPNVMADFDIKEED